jgi:two-component system LytT family sensor kinase
MNPLAIRLWHVHRRARPIPRNLLGTHIGRFDFCGIPVIIRGVEVAWRRVSQITLSYLWSILIWVAFAPVMAGQEKFRLLDRGLYTAYWNCLLLTGAWCVTAALLTPPIFSIVRRWPIARLAGLRRIAAYLVGVIPYLTISVCVRSILLPPYNVDTQEFTARSLPGVMHNAHLFAIQTWDYFMILAAAHAYEYFMRARKQELERAKLQQALAKSELQALKSQLRPHFLFNTLHGISTLIELDSARAKGMVLKLSSLLRTVLQESTSDFVTIDEELKFAEAYLDIEKMRLDRRLDIRWKIQPGVRQLLVPQLILQPLLENSILHGVACSRQGGWLEIGLRCLKDQIELSIRNSVLGKGSSGSGFGLQNTKAQLKYFYSDEATLSFAIGEDGVATALLLLPAIGNHRPIEGDTAKAKGANQDFLTRGHGSDTHIRILVSTIADDARRH